MTTNWRTALHAFFEERSREILSLPPSDERLCYVSGREPRLWSDPALYADLIESIRGQLERIGHPGMGDLCALPLSGQQTAEGRLPRDPWCGRCQSPALDFDFVQEFRRH